MNFYQMKPVALLLSAIALSLTLISCSSDPAAPAAGDVVPQPNPDGVLLVGDDSDNAVGATISLPPSPVSSELILDGLLSTRLTAFLNPDATTGQVNSALMSSGARIVAMQSGLFVVSLKIPQVADIAEAQSVATDLIATGAFLQAWPVLSAVSDPVSIETNSLKAHKSAEAPASHLQTSRVPAAWNAKKLAVDTGFEVLVIVPDSYYSLDPAAAISAQSFSGIQGVASTEFTGGNTNPIYAGNHGFHVSGLIGADPNGTFSIGEVGSNPAPGQLLDLQSVAVQGLSWFEIMMVLRSHMPLNKDFVINSSLGYSSSLTDYPIYMRVVHALLWRTMSGPLFDNYVHAVSAGNAGGVPGFAGDSLYGSPFAMATAMSPSSLLDPEMLSESETNILLQLLASPNVDLIPSNTLVVGSAAINGIESDFSSLYSDVRVLGENVRGPCVIQDPAYEAGGSLCDGESALYSGTSMAAPQVAGLAAYLWNLAPQRTAQEITDIIVHAWEESPLIGIVDAYTAVLSLDYSLADPRVRKTILDVAGNSDEPGSNNLFDHHDLKVFLDQFAANGGQELYDYSRYDLNGDGITGSNALSRFDLDVNSPSVFALVTQEIEGVEITRDELNLTDLDILCYYAYSPLYVGDEEARQILLAECTGGNSACPAYRLSVHTDWEAGDDYDSQTKYLSTHAVPATLTSKLTGGGNIGEVTVSVQSKSGKVVAHAHGVEGRANGKLNMGDKITFNAEGLEGTSGSCLLNVSVNATMTHSGDCEEGEALADWILRLGDDEIGDGIICHQVNNCGEPDVNGCNVEPPQQMEVEFTFIYGSPKSIFLSLAASVEAEEQDSGEIFDATVDVSVTWQGITGLPAGATMESCTETDWLTAGN